MRFAVVAILMALFAGDLMADDRFKFLLSWGRLGTGPGEFRQAGSMDVDGDGNVYVVDVILRRVQKFTNDGVFVTAFAETSGQIRHVSVAPSGMIYAVGDRGVSIFTRDGLFVRRWGSFGALPGQFETPVGIDVDEDGFVYVTDIGRNDVQKFDSDGAFIAGWGTVGVGPSQFRWPWGIKARDGVVYVVDRLNTRVQTFSTAGTFLSEWDGSPGVGGFVLGAQLDFDPAGNVLIPAQNLHEVYRFSSDGRYLERLGQRGVGDGEFDYPFGIAIDDNGNIFVSEPGDACSNCGGRVQKFGGGVTRTERSTWERLKRIYR
jgi:DNA-binding beta-propeller fold protein YncE